MNVLHIVNFVKASSLELRLELCSVFTTNVDVYLVERLKSNQQTINK